MSIEKSRTTDLPDSEREQYLDYGNLKIRIAKKVKPDEKPRLYKKVQETLQCIKSSLSDDIIKERIEN